MAKAGKAAKLATADQMTTGQIVAQIESATDFDGLKAAAANLAGKVGADRIKAKKADSAKKAKGK